MSSGSGPALAHRSVSNMRPSQQRSTSPTTPHTPPPRALSGSYGSPATIRADDDFLLIEIGARHVKIGFAGDTTPKAILSCGPEERRRVGDFRRWDIEQNKLGYSASDYEIWKYDMREMDLGLFRDKLDRLLRDAFTKYLLIDSRPRRAGLVLDSGVPIPLLSAVLDTLFQSFHAPLISLMSSPTMMAVGAGVRSAFVVDIGWAETVVTSIYEYREVKCTRSVRGGKQLHNATYNALRTLVTGKDEEDDAKQRVVSFEECEDIVCRLMWCRPSAFKASQRQSTQLDTVVEQDETEAESPQPRGTATVPISSSKPPTTLEIPFDKIADICDDALFDPSSSPSAYDDNELPLHWLIYQHLLQLPLDVRAVCMSRLMFTGGGSNILGIRARIVDEISSIVDKRGWTPVFGKGVDQLRNNSRLHRRSGASVASEASVPVSESSEETDRSRPSSIATQTEEDAIEAKLARNRKAVPQIQGQLRTIQSLGPWAGASLLSQLRIPAMATIDRELWLQQGANGASRPSEVDVKVQQRQSMGAGGLIRGSGGYHTNWTLGAWGSL